MTGARPTESHEGLLQVHNVSVAYRERTVLSDVSFRIDAGEFTGLIGANGSGKTTLFRVILGLQQPDRGSVELARAPTESKAGSIGYVPQKLVLDPEMPLRARDLVGLGIDGHRFGFIRRSAQREQRIEEMLVAVDALPFADRRLGTLSGGEQQRVLIAHALVSRPRLIVLDEPLANLDPGSVDEIVSLLNRVAHEQHVAVFISAHEMNALLPVMDRIIYIANGRVTSGTTEEVVRPDVLSALYGHHVDVVRLHGRVLIVAGHEGFKPELRDDHEELVVE